MKSIISLIVFICFLGWFASAIGQEQRVVSATKAEAPTRLAIPADKSHPGDISARPGVMISGACCDKQCKEGGTCGKKCVVVDSISGCSSNFRFECPSNKGLACLQGACSCE